MEKYKVKQKLILEAELVGSSVVPYEDVTTKGSALKCTKEWGYEYKSNIRIGELPLLHISFKYRNKAPVPAIGVISIGQFGAGIFNISQFGVGVVSISQFSIGMLAIGQIAMGSSIIAQIGLYVSYGYGQLVTQLAGLFG